VQYELNDDANAEKSLLRYVELTQHRPEANTSKGVLQAQARRAAIAARNGQGDKAMALLDSLDSNDPQDQRNILASKVELLREQKLWQKAYDLIEQSHTDDLDLMYEQAMLAERMNQVAPMERLLRRIIERDPKYYNAYNALGFSLADRGLRLKEARELIAKAVKLAPDDPFIADSMGWVEFKLGNHKVALALLQKAYSDKADPEIGAHLGEVLWKLDRKEEARKIWRDSQQAAPDNETLKNTLERIKPVL
jgi:Flp pilus assembly protein TadD